MTEVEIDYEGVLLEVRGTYVPEVHAVLNPVDQAHPGSSSDFDVTCICFDSDMDGDMVEVTNIYESLDKLDEIATLVISKIEEV